MLPFPNRSGGAQTPAGIVAGQPALFQEPAGRRWFGRDPIRNLARQNAWSGYEGPIDDEPVVAAELQHLTAELVVIFRSDAEVVRGRQDVGRAQDAEQRQRIRHEQDVPGIRRRIAGSAGVPTTGADQAAQARYSDGEAGRHEEAAAERRLDSAASRAAEANRRFQAVTEELTDLLTRHAAAGVALVNRYIAELNDVRTGEGMDAFTPLRVERTVRDLVLTALGQAQADG